MFLWRPARTGRWVRSGPVCAALSGSGCGGARGGSGRRARGDSPPHQPAGQAGFRRVAPLPRRLFRCRFANEVLEHVDDDAQAVRESYRVLAPGGQMAFYVPNRLYPFETHGWYWRGQYHFGNIPLINYLPNPVRNHLVPHVRAYTRRPASALFARPTRRGLSSTGASLRAMTTFWRGTRGSAPLIKGVPATGWSILRFNGSAFRT